MTLRSPRPTSSLDRVLKRSSPAVVVTDRLGAVVWSSPAARRHLEDLAALISDVPLLFRRMIVASSAQRDAVEIAGDAIAVRACPLEGPGEMYLIAFESVRRRDPLREAADRFRLSQREIDVAKFLADGASTALIARELGIAETTVLEHVKNIGTKTGVSRRSAIVAALLGTGGEAPI